MVFLNPQKTHVHSYLAETNLINQGKTMDIEQAKNSAISLAVDSHERGLLFNSMPSEENTEWENGDPETIETIVSLTLCEEIDEHTDDEAESILLQTLKAKFTHLPEPPEYIALPLLIEEIQSFDAFDLLEFILRNPDTLQNDEVLQAMRQRDRQLATEL